MLQEHHRIDLPNSRFEESFGVGGGRRDHPPQAGGMEKVSLQALAVLRSELMPAALRCSNDYRHCGLTTEHIVYLGRTIDYLIHREQREVYSHQLDYRFQPTHRGANPCADDSQFRYRSIADALFAVHREQSVGDLERAAEIADLLTHDEDPLVAIEFLAQRLIQSFPISDLRHLRASALLLRRVNALANRVERRLRAFVGELDRIFDSNVDFGVHRGELGVRGALLMQQSAAQIFYRIALLPDSLFALGAILGRIGHRMTAKSVSDRLDQRGTVALARARNRRHHRGANLQHAHPVQAQSPHRPRVGDPI